MPIACDTLVRAGVLVTQDQARTIVEDAGLALFRGAVLATGPWAEISLSHAAPETLDLDGHLVLPGLINAHCHAPMTLFRGMEDDLPLLDWLTQHIWPAEARLDPEIVAIGARLACAEMLAGGTTCFADLYFFEEQVARAVLDSGMRAALAEGIITAPRAFERIEALESACSGQTRLKSFLAAHSVYATQHDTLVTMAELAERRGQVLSLHAAESPAETALCLERFGRRPVAILGDLGLLRENLLVAHAVDVRDDEIALLAEQGVKVAHNPRSNMKLASGAAPVEAMRRAGVSVALGTDGAASNNSLNLFGEMGAAALLAKVSTGDPTALPAQAVLDMATRNAALALGWPEIGSLEPGQRADLCALDLAHPGLNPLNDPVSHLVYAAGAAPVRLTMVEGRVVYRDGRFPGLDHQSLRAEAAKALAWVRKVTGA